MTSTHTASEKYTLRISRLTIDKLGIQMYDRVSAVLAELIANCYDADSERVQISLPFGRYLAQKEGNQVKDLGFEIRIEDNGSGMTAEEVNEYYLLPVPSDPLDGVYEVRVVVYDPETLAPLTMNGLVEVRLGQVMTK